MDRSNLKCYLQHEDEWQGVLSSSTSIWIGGSGEDNAQECREGD